MSNSFVEKLGENTNVTFVPRPARPKLIASANEIRLLAARPMRNKITTSTIYLLTAATGSLFAISRNNGWVESVLAWLCVCAVPLFFIFAYSRTLPCLSFSRRRVIYESIFHVIAAIAATVLFTLFSPFWKNQVRDVGESLLFFLVPLSVLVVFLVAGLSLLLKKKSTLAIVAILFIWPYWFLLAMATEGYFYQDLGIYAVGHFLLFVSPIFFAFAAGAVIWQPRLAHGCALLGFVAVPSAYWNLKDSGLGNVWVLFNQPNGRFNSYPPGLVLGIPFVGLLAVSLGISVLRLLPSGWTLRKIPASDRTWPAVAASLVFMIVWFCQSVTPYRLPGALDYSGWPILQILRVEKRGLQFHETRVSVEGYKRKSYFDIRSVGFSENDRRLLSYRFSKTYSTAQLNDPLREQIRAMLTSSSESHPKWEWVPVKPVRNWNADNWYVIVEGAGLKVYTKENKTVPPPDVVNLFNQLEILQRSSPHQEEMRDVCLGFCYDPLSAMGYLFANHRCFNAGQGMVCR